MNTNPVDPITGLQEGPLEGLDTTAQNAWEGPVIEANKKEWQSFCDNANRILKQRYADQSANYKYIVANHDPNFPKPDMPKGWRVDFTASPWNLLHDLDLGIPEVQPNPVLGQGQQFKGNPVGPFNRRSAGPAGIWPRKVDWYDDLSKVQHDQSPYEPINWQAMGVKTTNGIHVYGGGRFQLFGWPNGFSDSPLDKTPRSIRGDERLWCDLFSADAVEAPVAEQPTVATDTGVV